MDSHLSMPCVATRLMRHYLKRGGQPHSFNWSCTEWGLHSVLCLQSTGALLPHLSTLAVNIITAVYFCCTILGVASTGRYPAFCPMVLGLSSCVYKHTRLPGLLIFGGFFFCFFNFRWFCFLRRNFFFGDFTFFFCRLFRRRRI